MSPKQIVLGVCQTRQEQPPGNQTRNQLPRQTNEVHSGGPNGRRLSETTESTQAAALEGGARGVWKDRRHLRCWCATNGGTTKGTVLLGSEVVRTVRRSGASGRHRHASWKHDGFDDDLLEALRPIRPNSQPSPNPFGCIPPAVMNKIWSKLY